MPGERSWWRLAETMDGTLVGFAIPSATPYHRNVGYLGVVPELRGCRYVDDSSAEITRFHAADAQSHHRDHGRAQHAHGRGRSSGRTTK